MRKKFQKRRTGAFSSNNIFLLLFAFFSIVHCNNVTVSIDVSYYISGSMTMTEFVLLALVMLEDSGMLDTYVGEILNKTKKRDNTKGVDELEPRGKDNMNAYLINNFIFNSVLLPL